jgi:hypothetical protein
MSLAIMASKSPSCVSDTNLQKGQVIRSSGTQKFYAKERVNSNAGIIKPAAGWFTSLREPLAPTHEPFTDIREPFTTVREPLTTVREPLQLRDKPFKPRISRKLSGFLTKTLVLSREMREKCRWFLKCHSCD